MEPETPTPAGEAPEVVIVGEGLQATGTFALVPSLDPDACNYVAAVVANQVGCELPRAAEHVGRMPADMLAALVDAGRNGRVAECRSILGLPKSEA